MPETKKPTMMESETPKTAEELLVQMYLKLQIENEALKQQLNKRGVVLEKVCEEFTALKDVLKRHGYYDDHGESHNISLFCSFYDWQSDKEKDRQDYEILKKYVPMSDTMKKRLEEEAKKEEADTTVELKTPESEEE